MKQILLTNWDILKIAKTMKWKWAGYLARMKKTDLTKQKQKTWQLYGKEKEKIKEKDGEMGLNDYQRIICFIGLHRTEQNELD